MSQPLNPAIDPSTLEDFIDSTDDISAILGEPTSSQNEKIIDHVDAFCAAWIRATSFIAIASIDRHGAMDVSPKGDPPGFVKVLNRQTIAIPDRPGNRRADTFRNVIQNPSVGVMCVVPGRLEVVRINGSARIARDAHLLEAMAINEKAPQLALVIDVHEAFFHCAKAMIRSSMWKSEGWPDIDDLPSYAAALKAHSKANADTAIEAIQSRITSDEVNRLY